jgi:phage replication O-like protein O
VANPQLKNGYTKIANELLEAICRLNVSGNEMRILLYIIRRTYGFSRSYAEISLSEIASAVGIRPVHISRALKKLSALNLIELRSSGGVKPQTISIVKDYEEWAVESCVELLLPKMVTVTKNGNPTITKNGNPTYKENNKEIIKERGKERKPHGRYENVFLSDNEIIELNKDYGEDNVKKYIQKVDSYVQSQGKKYTDYDAVIRKWLEDDGVDKTDIEKYKFVINKF